MISEHVARRRRLRQALGEWGQGLFDFMVFGGLVLGSAGLLLRPWMAAAAPWGFAAPALFALGLVLLESRRRRALSRAEDVEAATAGYDWAALLWTVACAVMGAAAFVIAWGAEPPPPPEAPAWAPPENAVSVDISP